MTYDDNFLDREVDSCSDSQIWFIFSMGYIRYWEVFETQLAFPLLLRTILNLSSRYNQNKNQKLHFHFSLPHKQESITENNERDVGMVIKCQLRKVVNWWGNWKW